MTRWPASCRSVNAGPAEGGPAGPLLAVAGLGLAAGSVLTEGLELSAVGGRPAASGPGEPPEPDRSRRPTTVPTTITVATLSTIAGHRLRRPSVGTLTAPTIGPRTRGAPGGRWAGQGGPSGPATDGGADAC